MASRRYPFLAFAAGVNWQKVDPALLSNLNALGRLRRQVVTVTSGYRDYAKQAALYERYKNSGFNVKYIAAKPGTSKHETGAAVDATIGGVPVARAVSAKQLASVGLATPVKGDPVHVQLAGASSAPAAPSPEPQPAASSGTVPTVVPPVGQAPPAAPPQPATGVALPGSQDYTIQPSSVAETWQTLAADPFASAETKQLAQYATLASGG